MEIKGQITEIIYQNQVNSYTVCVIETETEETTAVGYLPFVNSGDTIKAQGKYITHQEYGEQFKIETFEKLMPETLEALERYLGSGTIKGLGPATAKKIVDKFGEDTLNIFKFEPAKLSSIKGISESKAIDIGEEFNTNWELYQIVGFLERFGISINNANKVYKALGKEAITEIEKNPYILLDIVYGVDFKAIDKMALDLGMEHSNISRIQSAIKYALSLVSLNGHCCSLKENVITFVKDLLGVSVENIEDCIINLKVKDEIMIEKREGIEEWMYLNIFYKTEENIVENIKDLINYKHKKKLKNINIKSDIILTEVQQEAVKQVVDNNVCIITGGPGTGKTTIIRQIIDIFMQNNLKVALCAPTGRAAKKMTEASGVEAKTLHRLLEIGKIEDEMRDVYKEVPVTPIDADLVIVDEMSMVDIFLMNYLLRGIYKGTKLVLVGDVDQLPSVGPGSVLKDLIDSNQVPTITLTTIFRQAAQSKIVLNAHNVNNGENFIENKETGENIAENKSNNDFFYINEQNQEKMLYNVISLCKERLSNYGDYEFFKDMQVLTPTKKGMLGTKELNTALQAALNPHNISKKEKIYGQIVFRER